MEVTNVSPGYKVFTVCPQSTRSSFFFLYLANKLELVSRILVEAV